MSPVWANQTQDTRGSAASHKHCATGYRYPGATSTMGTIFESSFAVFPGMDFYGSENVVAFGPEVVVGAGFDESEEWQNEKCYSNVASLSSETPDFSSRPSSRTSSRPSSFHSSSQSSQRSNSSLADLEPYTCGLNPRIVDYETNGQDVYGFANYHPEAEFSSWTTDYSFIDANLYSYDSTEAPTQSRSSAPQFSFQPVSLLEPVKRSKDQPSTYSMSSSQPSTISSYSYPSRGLPIQWNSSKPSLEDSRSRLSGYQSFPYFSEGLESARNASELGPDDSISRVGRSKGLGSICPYPDCGKVFKDLKAHLVTHCKERPEKCPVVTCDYHVKGFCRKYDKSRHTLTHFKGALVCAFCPGRVATAEKTFGRADVFKRHLVSIHGAEQTLSLPGRKGSGSRYARNLMQPFPYQRHGMKGCCSICSMNFRGVQDYFNHLDECVISSVLRHASGSSSDIVRNEEMKSFNSQISHMEKSSVSDSVYHGTDEPEDHQRKRRKEFPRSWVYSEDQMKIKKRVVCAFDGPRRLWKDETILPTSLELDMPWNDVTPYVTSLDTHIMRRPENRLDEEDLKDENRFWTFFDTPKDYGIDSTDISLLQKFTTKTLATCTGARPTSRSLPLTQKTLTDHDRRDICRYYEEHPLEKQTDIAARFGVERSTVSKILRQKGKYLIPNKGSLSPIKGAAGEFPVVQGAVISRIQSSEKQSIPLTNAAYQGEARFLEGTNGNSEMLKSTSSLEKFKLKNVIGVGKVLRSASRMKISASSPPQASSGFMLAPESITMPPLAAHPLYDAADADTAIPRKKENPEIDVKREADMILSSCPNVKASAAETPGHNCGSFAPSPETVISEDASDNESVSDCSTDWGEDHNANSPGSDVYRFLVNSGGKQVDRDRSLLRPILSPMKQALVDRLMDEFWIIFNQEWATNLTKCAGETPSSSSPPGSNGSLIGGPSPHIVNRKRQRDDGEDTPPEDNNGRTPKRPNSQSERTPPKNSVKFACPYRKHAPHKYTIYKHRSCALSHWDTVARVKEHLYRRHRVPIQCKRCWQTFKFQGALDAHLTVVNICPLQTGLATEGLTADLEKKLKSRRKTSPNQTEEARWKEIYGLLFPNEAVPNPYFEPVQENGPQSPDSRDLADYEEYSRQELPRYFRSHLEDAVNNETQHLEENIRSQLVSMVQDCQARMFSDYKSRLANKDSKSTPGSTAIEVCITPSASQVSSEDAADPVKPESKDVITSAYQAPPPTPQSTLPYVPDLRDIRSANASSNIPGNISFSDSAYSSNGTVSSQSASMQSQTRQCEPPKPSDGSYEPFPFGDDVRGIDVNQDLSFEDTLNMNDNDFNTWWANLDSEG